jgi:hypothetical protein
MANTNEDVDYFEPTGDFGEYPDYIETVLSTPSIDTAVARLQEALYELSLLLSQVDVNTRIKLRNAFDQALDVYGENQTTAKNIIVAACPESKELQGELLDIVMFVRSRMNGVELELENDPELASFYFHQILNGLNGIISEVI